MSINQRVVQQLEQLAAKGPKQVEAIIQNPNESGYIVGVSPDEEQAVGVSLSLEDYDRFSAALRHLEVYHSQLTVDRADTEAFLRQGAEILSEKLTFLEEPLELVELDPVEGVAQIRSAPPQSNSDHSQVAYWEVVLQVYPKPHAKLTRYQWMAGAAERKAVTYPAAFAALGRMAESLTLSLVEV